MKPTTVSTFSSLSALSTAGAALVLALVPASVSHAQAHYNLTAIGGVNDLAEGISKNGLRTAGYLAVGAGTAFGTFNTTTPSYLSPAGNSRARAVSTYAEIVGAANNQATMWIGTAAYPLGNLGGTSEAYSINSTFGDAVGVATVGSGFHAFYKPYYSAIQDLGTLMAGNAGYSAAFHISEQGLIVGSASAQIVNGNFQSHACQWKNGQILDLDAGSPYASAAYGVRHWSYVLPLYPYNLTVYNDTAVGHYYPTPATTRPRTWTRSNLGSTTSVQNLPVLNASGQYHSAYSVNASGTIVGFSDTATNGNRHACRWQNGAIADLNTLVPSLPPNTVLTEARSISDDGQIVVWGTVNGQSRSFLLTPG